MRESRFQAQLIRKIRREYPGAIILKNDANFLQGFPDLTILFEDKYAVIEDKAEKDSDRQANQEYYINLISRYTYAGFAYPENEQEVLRELQATFRSSR